MRQYRKRGSSTRPPERESKSRDARRRRGRYKQRFLRRELRRPVAFYYTLARTSSAPTRCAPTGAPSFAAAACVEINQTQVARLNCRFDSTQAAAPLLPAGTRATRGRGASTSTRSSPTVALGDDARGSGRARARVADQRRDLPRDAHGQEDKIAEKRRQRVVVAEERVVVDGFRFLSRVSF